MVIMKKRKTPDNHKREKIAGWTTFWNENFKPVIFVSLVASLVILADEKDLTSSEKRRIILVADDERSPVLARQIQMLQSDSVGLTERDIIVETMTDSKAEKPFTFILVGDDGKEHFRSYLLQTPNEILNLIDELIRRKPAIKRET